MRPLRNFVRNLLAGRWRRPRPPAKKPNAPRIDFSYTIYWTKLVRQWDGARRARVRAALQELLARPDFEPNAYARRFRLAGLDESAHAGASLVALNKVLAAFEAEEPAA